VFLSIGLGLLYYSELPQKGEIFEHDQHQQKEEIPAKASATSFVSDWDKHFHKKTS